MLSITSANVTRIKTHLRTDFSVLSSQRAHLGRSSDASAMAVDRAYEEYCRRIEIGEDVDAIAFCKSHGSYQTALLRCIELHQFLDAHPETLDLLEPISWPAVGDVFDGKTIVAELGRGGVGRVYLAQESKLPRQVVLKVSALDNGEAVRLSRLEHKNIVPIYGVDDDPATGLTAICMPFQSRYTLHDLLGKAFERGVDGDAANIECVVQSDSRFVDSRPSRWDDVLEKVFGAAEFIREKVSPSGTYVDGVVRLGADIASALQHCHAHRVYHLDLKPSNVLLTPDGTPMLIDFGVSTDEDHQMVFGGTKPYMSPEQIRKMLYPLAPGVPDPDGKSDVYSLAIILCQLLTGKHPFAGVGFEGSEQQLLLHQQQWDAGQQLGNFDLPSVVVQLLGDCLSTDLAQRPTSRELCGRLNRLLVKPKMTRRRVLTAGFGSVLLATALPLARDESVEIKYARGFDHLVNKQWDAAIEVLSTAIEEEPRSVKCLSARAAAYCSRNNNDDLVLAREDYFAGYRSSKRPEFLACIAYCDAMLGDYSGAISNSRESRMAGCDSAEVRNIEGFSCLKMNIGGADDILNDAVESFPESQPAWYNLAIADVQRAVVNPSLSIGRSKRCIEKAIEIGPVGPMLLFDQATILQLQIRNTPEDIADVAAQRGHICNLLIRSLEMGLDPKLISMGPVFRETNGNVPAVLDDPGVQRQIASGKPKNRLPDPPRVVHPLASIDPRLQVAVLDD